MMLLRASVMNPQLLECRSKLPMSASTQVMRRKRSIVHPRNASRSGLSSIT